MAECIHGFPEGLCDSCYPRKAPEPVRVARTATARAARPPVRASGTSSAPPTLKLSGRRVFHVTHVQNLESIALDGALVSGFTPDVDVSSATARELRATATVPDGRSVAEFVAFFLAQDATRWQELRDGAEGAHWSDAARAAKATEFVILAVAVDSLGPDVVFADADAAGSVTRFAEGIEAGTQALRRLHNTDPDFRDAELLVARPVTLESVAIITVASEKVRDAVRSVFDNAGMTAPRIAVYPPAFQPTDEA